jgi:ketosteroid isomerase-like protein
MKRIMGWALVGMLLSSMVSIAAMAADKSDVAGRAATWAKEYNANNLAGVVALYTPDGCRMPPNQPLVRGRDAILAQLKAGKDAGLATVKVTVTAADSSGDVGYGTGTYEVTHADGSHADHGKWMLYSKKVDGKWLTDCDIFNSDMAMPSGAMK